MMFKGSEHLNEWLASDGHQERGLPPGTIREIRVIVVPPVDARQPCGTPAPRGARAPANVSSVLTP